ncbi:protein-histidine N-methyltransferase, partial [Phenoliferia sp. Uapishka_3]
MTFSFAFDVEHDSEDEDFLALETAKLDISSTPATAEDSFTALPHNQHSLESLLETLPPLISYTPVTVQLSKPTTSASQKSTTLLRRDLFDARFQVISQNESDDEEEQDQDEASGTPVALTREQKGKARETLVDEESDLVKGIYEGGLKTWECSLDLVDCLFGMGHATPLGEGEPDLVRGKSVLEVGCGTALPTCAIFSRLISEIRRSPSTPDDPPPKVTRIHLQDYNSQVLSLITLPNLLLAYAKNLAFSSSDTDTDSSSSLPAGDIDITPEFLASFESLLSLERIELCFFSGDWSSFHIPSADKYDLVLTSETIYSLPSLSPLLDLLQEACKEAEQTTCLVACKRIYFGVGGGELEFRKKVEERKGRVETVWGEGEGEGRSRGVGRVVMKIQW